jgi:hypothetical protein
LRFQGTGKKFAKPLQRPTALYDLMAFDAASLGKFGLEF